MSSRTVPLFSKPRSHAAAYSRIGIGFIALLIGGVARDLHAQSQSKPNAIAVREVTVRDKSSLLFANIFQVRQIANDEVLVNDGLRRQLILLDRGLAFSRVVLDSVSSGERYGIAASPIIAALGDSTLFVDREARALLLIGPTGNVVRATAAPTQPRDFTFLPMSRSGIDRDGNLVFRVPLPPTTPKRIGDTTSKIVVQEMRPPAMAPVLRASFDTRKTDTVIMVKQVSGVRSVITRDPATRPSQADIKAYLNPLETLDEWALLADGTIAVVRGADYHIDFVRPDGSTDKSAKLPFDWKPLTEENKQRIIDSTRSAMAAIVEAVRVRDGNSAANMTIARTLEDMLMNPTSISFDKLSPMPERKYTEAERTQPMLNYEIGPISEMPDYYPPIRQGAAMGDADGALWILPATSSQSRAGELVYDVVSGRGELTHRVRLPLGRSVAGFGRGGVVYLVSKEKDGWRLERAVLAKGSASQLYD